MLDAVAPDQPASAPDHLGGLSATGLALQLPADAYWQLTHTLRLTLPPPFSDGPDDLARRDHAVIARVAALVPANAAEAELAAQFVAASEQWKDCLRLAQDPEATLEWARKCRAQANAMMRQANGALRLLLRLQDARRKLEADNAAADRAAWTEHRAISLMAEALAEAAVASSLAHGAGEDQPRRPADGPDPDPDLPPAVSHGDPTSRHSRNETEVRPPPEQPRSDQPRLSMPPAQQPDPRVACAAHAVGGSSPAMTEGNAALIRAGRSVDSLLPSPRPPSGGGEQCGTDSSAPLAGAAGEGSKRPDGW